MIFMPILIGMILPVAQIALLTFLVYKISNKSEALGKLTLYLNYAFWFYIWLLGYNRTSDGLGDGALDLFVSMIFGMMAAPWLIATGLEAFLSLETGSLGGWP